MDFTNDKEKNDYIAGRFIGIGIGCLWTLFFIDLLYDSHILGLLMFLPVLLFFINLYGFDLRSKFKSGLFMGNTIGWVIIIIITSANFIRLGLEYNPVSNYVVFLILMISFVAVFAGSIQKKYK